MKAISGFLVLLHLCFSSAWLSPSDPYILQTLSTKLGLKPQQKISKLIREAGVFTGAQPWLGCVNCAQSGIYVNHETNTKGIRNVYRWPHNGAAWGADIDSVYFTTLRDVSLNSSTSGCWKK